MRFQKSIITTWIFLAQKRSNIFGNLNFSSRKYDTMKSHFVIQTILNFRNYN